MSGLVSIKGNKARSKGVFINVRGVKIGIVHLCMELNFEKLIIDDVTFVQQGGYLNVSLVNTDNTPYGKVTISLPSTELNRESITYLTNQISRMTIKIEPIG